MPKVPQGKEEGPQPSMPDPELFYSSRWSLETPRSRSLFPARVTSVLPDQHRPGSSSLTCPPPSCQASSRLSHAQRPRHSGSCDDFRPLFSQSPCVDILLALLLLLQNSAWMSPVLIRFPKPPLPPPRLDPLLISLSD